MKTDRRAVRTILRAKGEASSFVESCLNSCMVSHDGMALDIPCGAGRHISSLQARGFKVVGADLSSELLKEAALRYGSSDSAPTLTPAFVQLDGARALPFAEETFDAVLVVHFFLSGLIGRLAPLLKPGGYFILETFGAQGGNRVHLPLVGQVRHELSGSWQVHEHKERVVRVAPDRRVTQFFARRGGV